MKKYEFYRREFKWAEEFYDVIQKKMQLPGWFGKNADALWDMLTGYIETPCEIVLIGFNQKENDYNANIINNIIQCIIDVAHDKKNQITVTIKEN